MKSLLSLFLIIIPFLSFSQNPPNCDSLTIDCCIIFNNNSDSIELNVANSFFSTELFNYPGFILIDENGDTIGMEQVNYFGIGNQGQNHYLEIMNPFTLPFSGTLELYTGFYDSLHCVFPIEIIDPTSSNEDIILNNSNISIYPNPAKDFLNINIEEISKNDNYNIRIYQADGKYLTHYKLEEGNNIIPIKDLVKNHIYFIQATDNDGNIIATKKLLTF